MYIKPPKKVGDSYAAMVVETGGKTKCIFEESIACDVDDVWARFLVKSSCLAFDKINKIDDECTELVKAWTAENNIEAPSSVRGPVTEISKSDYKMLKVRVPRDGYEFVSGKSYSISICIRDVKTCGGKVMVHWRVEDYFEICANVDVDESRVEKDKETYMEPIENKNASEIKDSDIFDGDTNAICIDESNNTEVSEYINLDSKNSVSDIVSEEESKVLLDATISHLHGALSRVRKEADEIETYINRVIDEIPKRISNIKV
jgi:hypothetical protein